MSEQRLTTIEYELDRMREAVEEKLLHFKPAPADNVVEKVLHIFKSSSRVSITPEEYIKMREVVSCAVKNDRSIKLSFLWALCRISRSPWKFSQPHLIEPRLADYWAAFWFDMVCQKIKKVYPPGCEFYIIDEFSMVKHLGWTREEADKRMAILKLHYSKFSCLKIIDLPDFDNLPEAKEPSLPQILSTLLSAPVFFGKLDSGVVTSLMDAFYIPGEKDWLGLKSLVPDTLWNEVREAKKIMSQIAEARRISGWLSQDLLKGEPFIDAAIIDRGTWSPGFCDKAMPQHGGSVLKAIDNAQYSISVVPEYRLKFSHDPVSILLSGGEEMYFYWVVKK